MEDIILKCNEKFESFYKLQDLKSFEFKLSDKFFELLEEGFVNKDGCYYYKRFAPQGPVSDDLRDRTGNEAFYNKIQIDDFSTYADNNEDVFLKEGIAFALTLANKLINLKEKFNVYVIYDKIFCTIVFHKRRENEYWLVEDLNQYKKDAVMLLEVNM